MSLFIAICAGLIVLGSLFFLWPTRIREDEDARLAQANLKWYQLREAELEASGDDRLREDIALRLLEDEAEPVADKNDNTSTGFPAWILVPVTGFAAVILYYLLGASADVQIAQKLRNVDAQTDKEAIQALMKDIENRSIERPDNLHYMALLGRFHMGREDYTSGLAVYERLLAAVPEDGQALAFAAQAEYLAKGRQLTDQARLRAEQALAADPHQRTALSLLGMASFEQEEFRAAINYWQRLKATEPANSEGATMIASVIAQAKARLGERMASPGGSQQAKVAGEETAPGLGITVSVQMPEGLALAPSDTVFVLARNAQTQSRMPIAVKRLTGSDLPITLRLDDSLSMAGQKLSETPSVIVAVQVSPDGRPGEAGASWLGQIGPVAPTESVAPMVISLTSTQ
ncbi:MAG: cytochrome C biogenesis protein [Halioglobus sp.]